MKLYYTPRSHFARKVRILLDAWGADATLTDIGNVAERDAGQFGDNPLMQVPALVDGAETVFDSDHIAQYLVRRLDPDDRFRVMTAEVDQLNARAIMNGVMSAEVQIVLARRTGIDTNAYVRFEKFFDVINSGLTWLEAHAGTFDDAPSYGSFHLVALWEHLVGLDGVRFDRPRLSALVERTNQLPYVTASRPPSPK